MSLSLFFPGDSDHVPAGASLPSSHLTPIDLPTCGDSHTEPPTCNTPSSPNTNKVIEIGHVESDDANHSDDDATVNSSTNSNDDDDDDDSDDDDDAELSPERAKEIADQTAAFIIVHDTPPRRVRGILSTSNTLNGNIRSLSASVLAQRKKGLRWHMDDGFWSERAVGFRSPATPRVPTPAAAPIGEGRWAHKSADAGEGAALHKTITDNPPSTPLIDTDLDEDSPTNLHPSSTLLTPRQYTSSARLAGSSSFKARLAAGPDRSDAPNLTHTLSSGTNLLLRVHQQTLVNLSMGPLQQLFLLYSRAGRHIRDRTGAWAEKDKRKHGGRKDSLVSSIRSKDSHTGLASTGSSFLASIGLGDPTSHLPQAVQWTDIDSSCAMSLDEMRVLALHLVQKKLDTFAQELSSLHSFGGGGGGGGKAKLMSRLKEKRFTLFVINDDEKDPNHTSEMDESQITDMFVQSTIQVMQDKLGKNKYDTQ